MCGSMHVGRSRAHTKLVLQSEQFKHVYSFVNMFTLFWMLEGIRVRYYYTFLISASISTSHFIDLDVSGNKVPHTKV